MPVFPDSEYRARLEATRARMGTRGIDVLVCTDPANMNYLTGYDGWSFYVPQAVVVALERPDPVWIGRTMDANGARETVFMGEENILAYPDTYVQNATCHPMDYVAILLTEYGFGRATVALEMDAYYFSPAGYRAIVDGLPEATFVDAQALVNWVRLIKSPAEIAYMRQAARICERAMATAVEWVEPGVRQCDAVAAIYQAQISGTVDFGGDYPAIAPMLPTGRGTSAPHLTWNDSPYRRDTATIIELAGCSHRYHCPMARTVYLGTPPQKVSDTAKVVVEGVHAALEAAQPGAVCADVEAAWRAVISRHGIEKESRLGYSTGLNYPPDWGEHTASLRPGDLTELRPDMTLHMIPGLWMDDWGIEISECFLVAEGGAKPFCDFERRLIVKEDV